jgi:hypothetical protein
VGDTVNVTGVDPLLNGSFNLTGIPGSTIKYADNATQTVAVTSRSISGTTATINTANSHTFTPGDQGTASTGDARFDGNFTAIAGSVAGVLKYTIPGVTTSINNAAAAGGTITLTASSVSNFETNDTVTMANLGAAYNGTPTVTVNGGAKTFAYTAANFAVRNTAQVGTTVTLRTNPANPVTPHGLHANDTVNISGFGGGQACLNNIGNTTVIATPATNTFTVTAPAGCAPGAGNGQARLVATPSAAASGTATLATTPSLSGSGNVTAPAFIGPTPITCNNCATLTDVPSTPVTGTFTPAWMPTAGIAQNPNGSPGGPSPLLINTNRTLLPGTYYGGICLGSANGVDCAGNNCAVASATTAYSPAVTLNTGPGGLNATQTNVPVKWTGGVDPVHNNDVIQIDSEQMLVINAPATTSPVTLTVQRAYSGTTGATHSNGTAVNKVNPPVTPPVVHLLQGEYIMAGGGFHVCGNMALDAPEVLIYNTNDPSSPGTTYGKVGQIEINTTGTVTLGPQTKDEDPLYAGFTIFGDRAQVVDPPTFKALAYNPVQSLAANIGANDPTFNTTGATPTIYPGNVICLGAAAGATCQAAGDELMMVTKVVNHTGSATLTVTRGYDGTTPRAWTAGTAVRSVTYGGDTCNSKANKALGGDHTQMDISFLGAGHLTGGFPLDNITGTIYAAGPRADFENAMFGDANLAVIVSCIFVDGGAVPPGLPAADFEFNPDAGNDIAGVDEALSE